jgi:hypothetical protein
MRFARGYCVKPARSSQTSFVRLLTKYPVTSSDRLRSRSVSEVRRCVYEAYEKGKLNEDLLAEFARSNLSAETAVALAVLTATPIETVTSLMECGQMGGLLVLCKSKNYRWPTAKAIIRIGHERPASDIEQARHEHYTLSVQSAARALRFVGARRALQKSNSHDYSARPINPEMEVLMVGLEHRSERDRRSGIDTRSDEARRLMGERRSGIDRRSGV